MTYLSIFLSAACLTGYRAKKYRIEEGKASLSVLQLDALAECSHKLLLTISRRCWRVYCTQVIATFGELGRKLKFRKDDLSKAPKFIPLILFNYFQIPRSDFKTGVRCDIFT